MSKKKIQLILLGEAAVGKTSIIKHYKDGVFNENHQATLGLDFIAKKYEKD